MARLAVPPGVVTATVTAPAGLAGVVAVICVALLTVTDVAAVPSKVTAVAPVRLVPLMTTLVPPAAGPVAGRTPVTDGGDRMLTVTLYNTGGAV